MRTLSSTTSVTHIIYSIPVMPEPDRELPICVNFENLIGCGELGKIGFFVALKFDFSTEEENYEHQQPILVGFTADLLGGKIPLAIS